MMENKGSYTVITGASSGLGYEAAKAFAGRGSNLILAARRRDRMEGLRREILEEHPALDVAVKVVDLSVPENVVHFYEDVKGYPLGTWVNSAGFGNYGSVGSEKPGKLGGMLRLNVEALATLSSLFVRDFKNVCGAQLTLSVQRNTRSEKNQFLLLLRCFPSAYVQYASVKCLAGTKIDFFPTLRP